MYCTYIRFVCVAAVGLAVGTFGAGGTEYTWTGGTGNWVTPGNWAPSGFGNQPGDSCLATNGTAQTDATTFQPQLRLDGTNGVGGTLELKANTTLGNGLRLEGGRIFFQNFTEGDLTISGSIEAVSGTSSRIEPYGRTAYGNDGLGGTITHVSGSFSGTGAIHIGVSGGAIAWPKNFMMDATASGYDGRIDIDRGTLGLKMNGTYSMGENARIYVNSGGAAALLGLVGTWTVKGGIYLNGGTVSYRDWGAASGTTWTPETPWTVLTNSQIQTYSSSGADILGSLYGGGDLRISHSRRDSGDTGAVNLRGTNSTYSGTITVAARSVDEGKTTLFIGHSLALSRGGNLAKLVIEETGGVKGRVTIGAWKSGGGGGGSVTSVDNVSVRVRRLTLGGAIIPVGKYSQANPLPVSGFIDFYNATASLEVRPSSGTVIVLR